MNFEPEKDVPKIKIESKQDVLYIKNEFDSLLQKCLESSTTIGNSGLDEKTQNALKHILLQDLGKYSEEVWSDASCNILVNGMDCQEVMFSRHSDGIGRKLDKLQKYGLSEPSKDDYEPLDESLNEEVRNLKAKADELLIRVTEKRRENYGVIEQAIKDELEKVCLVATKETSSPDLDMSEETAKTNPYKISGNADLLSEKIDSIIHKLSLANNEIQNQYNLVNKLESDLSLLQSRSINNLDSNISKTFSIAESAILNKNNFVKDSSSTGNTKASNHSKTLKVVEMILD
ncbi:hypothetical protein BB559_000031 [Furculomyces boomerangus]|uniref:Uncharacterized protein n=1 Tax=Furculomyces boomerangus TaxID=61424 RepID=A0A2T9Z4J0_9FUNG|nr:hypothetical protein BB559_000653 [Furculomyces boomerangus]PVV00211.1 hypothetical protein BB559_000031 [Furculomyces boomerangus]